MKEFPSKFVPQNLKHFQTYKYDRDCCYLREAIYESVLQEKPTEDAKTVNLVKGPLKNETKISTKAMIGNAASSTQLVLTPEPGPFETPFNLSAFKEHRNPVRFDEMIAQISKELKEKGWDVFVGHAGTSMWIFPQGMAIQLPDW